MLMKEHCLNIIKDTVHEKLELAKFKLQAFFNKKLSVDCLRYESESEENINGAASHSTSSLRI